MKTALLKDLISARIGKNPNLVAYSTQKNNLESLESYLFKRLDPLFKIDHDAEEVAITLDDILKKFLKILETKRPVNGTLGKLALDREFDQVLAVVAQQQEIKRNRLEQLNNNLFNLQEENYFVFLLNLQEFLADLHKSFPEALRRHKHLKDLFQSIHFRAEDILDLKQIKDTLRYSAVFDNKVLQAFEENLAELEVAMTDAYVAQDQPLDDQPFYTPKTANIIRKLQAQQHDSATYTFLINDIVAYLKMHNFAEMPSQEQLQASIAKYCHEKTFSYLTKANYDSFKKYIKKTLLEIPQNLSEAERYELYQKICGQILNIKQAEWHEPEPISIEFNKKLGAGGNNTVYLAELKDSFKRSTRKLVFRQNHYDTQYTKIELESDVVKRINEIQHPALITTYHGTLSGLTPTQKIEVQYVEYKSRGHLLACPLEFNKKAAVVRILIDLLKTFKNHNIAHLDFKYLNIVMDSFGFPKVIDFGAATDLSARIKKICFPEYYLPPEAVNADSHEDVKYDGVDYWGLGLILHQLYTGRDPFLIKRDNSNKFLPAALHVNGGFFMKNSEGNYTDPLVGEVADIICKLLENDPDKRVKNFEVLAQHDRVLGLTLQEAYDLLKPKDKVSQLKEEAAHLTWEQKTAYFQAEILNYKKHQPELTAEDDLAIIDHIEFYYDILQADLSSKIPDKKSVLIEQCKATLLSDKQARHQQELQQLEEALQELVVERNKPKKEANLKTLFVGKERYVQIIQERLGLLTMSATESESTVSIREKLYKKLKPSKKSTAEFSDLIRAKLAKIKKGNLKKQPYAVLVKATELANLILSSPDYTTNSSLKALYGDILVFMRDLKRNNPLLVVNTPKANLDINVFGEEKIQINKRDENAGTENKENKSPIAFNYKNWKKLLKEYNIFEKIARINLLMILRLTKKFNKTTNIDKKIKLATQIFTKCQNWLDKKDNRSKRLEVLTLQNAVIAELDRLLDIKAQRESSFEYTNIRKSKEQSWQPSEIHIGLKSKALRKARTVSFKVKTRVKAAFFGEPAQHDSAQLAEAVSARKHKI